MCLFVHAAQLQHCRGLPELSMLKVGQIIPKADQEHRLFDWREHVACEVAIQAACVAARFTPGLGHAHAGNG